MIITLVEAYCTICDKIMGTLGKSPPKFPTGLSQDDIDMFQLTTMCEDHQSTDNTGIRTLEEISFAQAQEIVDAANAAELE